VARRACPPVTPPAGARFVDLFGLEVAKALLLGGFRLFASLAPRMGAGIEEAWIPTSGDQLPAI